MTFLNTNYLLRVTAAVILIMHSIPSIFTGAVFDFGEQYLNQVGFAPFGVPIAWVIKLSHVATAICLLSEKFVKVASAITIGIFAMGIYMVHWPEGWFVVGGGRNGVEFNVLLIAVFLTFMFPASGYKKSN